MNYDLILQEFKSKKVWGVLGNVHDHKKYAYKIYNFLKNKGYEVYAIDPTGIKVDNEKTYTSIKEIPSRLEALDVVINPYSSTKYISEALSLGIRHIWFQPGAYNEEGSKLAVENGSQVVKEDCVMVKL